MAFPDLPLILGTSNGYLYFSLANGKPAGPRVDACDTGISNITTDGRRAAFFCSNGGDATLYLWDEASGRVTQLDPRAIQAPGAAFTADGKIVYVTLGRYESPAPIAMTKLVERDLATGATTTIDERYGVAFELRATDAGVAVWRPKDSLSFMRSDEEAGTWMLRGTSLMKLTQYRLVDGHGGASVLESEAVDPNTGFFTANECCTYVVRKDASGEVRITPPSVANEKALAMLDDGRIVVWRFGRNAAGGSVVVYAGTNAVRNDVGVFTSYRRVVRAGDWVIAPDVGPSGGPSSAALRAYNTVDGTFAEMPLEGVSSFGVLGAKP